MNKDSKICVLGSNGLVGSAIIRELKKQGYTNVFPIVRKDCDLINTASVNTLFALNKFDYVFNAAGKVGGN